MDTTYIMAAVRILIMFGGPLIDRGESYFQSNCSSRPEFATELCHLATPDIVYTEIGQTAYITDLPSNESLWVGYFQDYTAFSYVGCLSSKDFNTTSSTSYIQADPGHCFSYCKTQYLGIRKTIDWTLCYCIDIVQDDIALNKSCTISCSFPNGTLCGGEKTVSVYRHVQYNTYYASTLIVDGKERQCLAFDPYVPTLFWSSCKNILGVLCTNGSNLVYDNYEFSDWAGSMKSCSSKGYVSADSETDFSSIPSTIVQLWIGTIRSFSISDLSESETRKQGYIISDQNRNRSDLHFDTNNYTLHGLCNGGGTVSGCTSTTPFKTASVTSVSSSAAAATTTKPVKPTTREEHGGTNLVAVYVVVPVLLLAAAVAAAAYLLWRRRRNVRGREEGRAESHGTDQDNGNTSNAGAIYQNAGVIDAINGNENTQHDYQDLTPQYQNTTTHEYSTLGIEAQLNETPQHQYQDLNYQFEKSTNHEYSTVINEAQPNEDLSHEYLNVDTNIAI